MAGTAETIIGDYLCTVDFHVAGGIHALGGSPFGERRIGYVTGGSFTGPRLTGQVLEGGGNWSVAGRLDTHTSVGTMDARAIWRTDDGALIYVSYAGRSVIPDDVRAEFADPARASLVDPARYYLRIAPVFETASPVYAWLNGVLAIGIGERTDRGARHRIYVVR
jgi:hypothetical protein